MDSRAIGIAAALGSAAAWAAGAVLLRGVGDGLSSFAMTLVKGASSVVLLGLALLAAGATRVGATDLALLAGSGLVGIAVGDTCFFEALKGLGPASVVLLTSAGVVVTPLLAAAFLGESTGAWRWAGIALVVAGIAIALSAGLPRGASRPGFRGVAFGLAAVLSMALSTVAAKRGAGAISALEATLIRMAAGTAGVLALGVATGRVGRWMSPFGDVRILGRFALAVAVVTFGGFWLSLAAIQRLDLATANTVGALEPILTIPLAAVLLGERPSVRGFGGSAVATAGVALLCWA